MSDIVIRKASDQRAPHALISAAFHQDREEAPLPQYFLCLKETPQKVFWLERWYTAYSKDPQSLAVNLERLVRRVREHQFPKTFAQILPRLRLQLMDSSYLQLHTLRAALVAPGSQSAPTCQPLAGTLFACLMEEDELFTLPVPQTVLQEWGLNWQQALQQVLDAHRQTTQNFSRAATQRATRYSTPNSHTLAHLILDERRRHELPPDRPLMMLMPQSNALYFAPVTDEDALDVLGNQIDRVSQRPSFYHSSCALLLTTQENRWHSIQPPAVVSCALERAQREFLPQQYHLQHPLLQQHLRQQQLAVDVAPCLKLSAYGTTVTATVCKLGQHTLLPTVDIIGWRDPRTGQITCTRTQSILDSVPRCLEHSEWSPPRWRVSAGPPVEQLQALAMPPPFAEALQRADQRIK